MLLKAIRDRLTDALLARRVDRWLTAATVVLLVAFGFLLGKWTSLTDSGAPIVFQNAPGASDHPVSGEELRALVVEENRGNTSNTDLPALGAFVASSGGQKYYHPDCAEVRRIKEENRVWFDSEEEAQQAGYEPSQCVLKEK